MNAHRLLELYDRIAEAPDAVDRLRRFVLDLAVRGKLVEQDASDEPASELLNKVVFERAKLVDAGAAKKAKSLDAVDEPPFEIPDSWIWSRLGIIAGYIQRGKSPKYAARDGAPVVSQKCVQWSGLDLSVAKQVTREALEKYETIRFLQPGDLLWNSTGTGTIGRIIRLVDPPAGLVCDSHVTVVRCVHVNPEFVRTWLRSDHVYGVIEDSSAGSTNQIELTAKFANNQPVPIPPLAEQQRIVAKVEELMALLGRLEATRTARETIRDRLTTASLARLTAPDSDPEAFPDHARFALDALPALTARPKQIGSLRETILNLAIRGRLVEQDPSDEPASELMDRLQRRREELIDSKKLRRLKMPPKPDSEELGFNVPTGWLAARLGEIYDVRDGTHDTPKYVSEGVPLVTSKNLSSGVLSFDGVKLISEEDHRKISQRSLVEKNDVLFAMIGSIGNPVIVDTNKAFSIKNVALFKYIDSKDQSPKFLKYLLEFASHVMRNEATGGLQPFVSLGYLRSFPIALPPLVEQHRIAEKVDELMGLTDRLEAAIRISEATRGRLLEATLHKALGAPSSEREAA
ncbi:restriction endonuclease subunit S [Wenzhouxiangella sp. EGI_FJ10305]|uniref:restriction endonuclease subunit S n=1 Tax=Wenzhouxiangella sp. EGI_FJ10305 TaxID=3243768 RepID=UPI0035E0F192